MTVPLRAALDPGNVSAIDRYFRLPRARGDRPAQGDIDTIRGRAPRARGDGSVQRAKHWSITWDHY